MGDILAYMRTYEEPKQTDVRNVFGRGCFVYIPVMIRDWSWFSKRVGEVLPVFFWISRGRLDGKG